MILRAFKYRPYPTSEQQTAFAKHFGCARWLYNWGLNKKTMAYKATQKSISRFELSAELPSLKKTEETAWLSEVNSHGRKNC